MPIPLKELEDFNGNVYEITSATIRRAVQLTVTGSEELGKSGEKIVTAALRQVFKKEVNYQLME